MAKTAKKTSPKITFAPIEDRVLIQPTEAETVSTGGIVLPDSAQEKPQRGRVLATGPGKLGKDGARLPMPVNKGDEVIYGKYSGNEVEIEGESLKILRVDEILAKVAR